MSMCSPFVGGRKRGTGERSKLSAALQEEAGGRGSGKFLTLPAGVGNPSRLFCSPPRLENHWQDCAPYSLSFTLLSSRWKKNRGYCRVYLVTVKGHEGVLFSVFPIAGGLWFLRTRGRHRCFQVRNYTGNLSREFDRSLSEFFVVTAE